MKKEEPIPEHVRLLDLLVAYGYYPFGRDMISGITRMRDGDRHCHAWVSVRTSEPRCEYEMYSSSRQQRIALTIYDDGRVEWSHGDTDSAEFLHTGKSVASLLRMLREQLPDQAHAPLVAVQAEHEKSDKRAIFTAASQAQKAADFLQSQASRERLEVAA
jgi:hypothetical protein